MSIREEPTPDPPGEGTQGYSGAVETKRQRCASPAVSKAHPTGTRPAATSR